MASDEDTTPFLFALAGELSDIFEMDPLTGVIAVVESLDYERVREYPNLTLIVLDVDFMHSNATFRIVVQDENDNSPKFVNGTVQIPVPELSPVGSEIFIAMATDSDDTSNAQLTYSLAVNDNFLISPLSGAITVGGELDFEMQQSYSLEVTATDSGSPARSSSMTLIVEIVDQNDNAPSITNSMPTYSIRENVAFGELVGTVNATDQDSEGNAMLRFSITAGNEANHFSIDNETGNIFTSASIDREQQSTYSLTVEVCSYVRIIETLCA